MTSETLVSILLEDVDPELLKAAQSWLFFNGSTRLMKMAIDSGFNVNTKHRLHGARLIWAAQWGHTSTVRFLLSVPGIDVDIKDLDGLTPLHHAVTSPHSNLELIKLLIDAGADVNVRTWLGNTPLDRVFQLTSSPHDIRVQLLKSHGAKRRTEL